MGLPPRFVCPCCGRLAPAEVVALRSLPTVSIGRTYSADHYEDLIGVRRARQCRLCGKTWTTFELPEEVADELVKLRSLRASVVSEIVDNMSKQNQWLVPGANIPYRLAYEFVADSAWWLTHSSGSPVRAPGHARRLYSHDEHGWAVDFGANTFLAEVALSRCALTLHTALEDAAVGARLDHRGLRKRVVRAVRGAVANYSGEEYAGYYPCSGSDMVFGAQSIDTKDACNFLFKETGIDRILELM